MFSHEPGADPAAEDAIAEWIAIIHVRTTFYFKCFSEESFVRASNIAGVETTLTKMKGSICTNNVPTKKCWILGYELKK